MTDNKKKMPVDGRKIQETRSNNCRSLKFKLKYLIKNRRKEIIYDVSKYKQITLADYCVM